MLITTGSDSTLGFNDIGTVRSFIVRKRLKVSGHAI